MEQIKQYLDELLARSTPERPIWNQEAILEHKPPKWSYIDGCMAIAILSMYEATGEAGYFNFLQEFIDYYVDQDGRILGYNLPEMNSDAINEGKVLFALYEATQEPKYRRALDKLYQQIKEQPRTASGSFWHKLVYPEQVWLDGLYMVQPFYTEYEGIFNQFQNVGDILLQFENVNRHMKDPVTGLLYHGFDESRRSFWADPVTGCSASFWSRSLGWYAMALVDTFALLPAEFSEEQELLLIYLNELLEALLRYQDPDSKLFYQVTDQGDRAGNYLETSASCAIAYTLLKGARIKMLPPEYQQKGQEILAAVVEHKLHQTEHGYQLRDICLIAGLGGMAGKGAYPKRDGSYAYYISEPVVADDAKGIGPLVYAYAEYLKLQQTAQTK